MTGDDIPLVDLAIQHAQIADEVEVGFKQIFESSAYVGGAPIAEFETEFAHYTGVEHCVAVANGTDAIELALRAAGIGSSDRVVLPANTFVATAEAVVRAGARPVPVDCDPDFQLIDPEAAASAVDEHNARFVIGVDLFGQCAPFTRLEQALAGRECVLLEDAAQSQGATADFGGVASRTVAATTSFYPGKNLGAYGDGGAILTNHADLADGVQLLRNHGSRTANRHEVLGFNSRLDTLQAVVLSAKLRRLDAWNDERRAAADRYGQALVDLPSVGVPAVAPGNTHVWHVYVVRVPDRDRILQQLREAGIGAGVHYPTPIHLQPAFADLGFHSGDFPHAEAAAREILSLPMFPGITAEQQQRVVAELSQALDGAA